MADIVVTAANVAHGANALIKVGTAGATITAGQPVYLDSATGKYKLADNNLSAAAANAIGIALNGCSDGQPIQVVYDDDDFTPGATLTLGTIYVLSATAGGIAPSADLASGNYMAILFVPKSTSKAVLKLLKSGVAQ